MMSAQLEDVGVPTHPLISDTLARSLLRAIMDAEIIGVALLQGPQRTHMMLNAAYQALLGAEPALGRDIGDVFPDECAPAALLEKIEANGRPGRVLRAKCPRRTPEGALETRYVDFTYLRVADDRGPSIAVLAEDVTTAVHDSVRADLFLVLLGDLAAAVEPRAAVSSVLASTRDALGAQDVSLFLVDADVRELRGAPGEWDWTRTSFTVPLAEWPSVGRALAHGTPIHMTVADASGAEAGWFERRGIGATFCVPIRATGRAIGVLFFDFTAAVVAPEEAAVRFVEAVAAACGVALERAFRSETEIELRHSVEHTLQDRERFIADVATRITQTLVDVTASARQRDSTEMGGEKSAASMSNLDRRVKADLELLSALRERRWERAAALLPELLASLRSA